MSPAVSAAVVAQAAERACVLEASAPKPGNVHPGRGFHDMQYHDFVVSAQAIAPVMGRAGAVPLGQTIFDAIEATRRVTRANTNLGIILLFAPLARAAQADGGDLRLRTSEVLDSTSIDDAIRAYDAIRVAFAGGLGTVGDQDISNAPSVTLRDAMRLAAERDSIAGEYSSGYALTFGISVPALRRARSDRLEWPDAVVESYLTVLAARPDTLIQRKLGADAARQVSEGARAVLDIGGVRTRRGMEAIKAFDQRLSDPHNSRNPGTTADLIAAGLFVLLLEDGLH